MTKTGLFLDFDAFSQSRTDSNFACNALRVSSYSVWSHSRKWTDATDATAAWPREAPGKLCLSRKVVDRAWRIGLRSAGKITSALGGRVGSGSLTQTRY